jgi:hypothetical protein
VRPERWAPATSVSLPRCRSEIDKMRARRRDPTEEDAKMTTTRPSQPLRSADPGQPADSSVSRLSATQSGEQPRGDRPGRRRRRPTNPSSAHALAMLTLQPIFSASVPRLHVGPRGTDGSMLVDDRASGRRFRVYTPRLDSEFRAGYRAGLWYVRTSGDVEPSPRSPGFATPGAAIDTLRSSRDPSPQGASLRHCCRIIWS